MAGLVSTGIAGFLTSAKFTGKKVLNAAGEMVSEIVEDFMSGFAGYGWKIWEYVKGKWMLEIDSIRVREQFIVFEMLVSKMRAIIGSLGISQACGKIATVTLSEDGTEYLITLEDETMSFVAHDFMRCQTYSGTKQTFYHVEIASVVDDMIHVSVSEFDKDEEGNVINPPEVGNDIVQFGNSVNKNRQSAIYIHADESGQPAIDIMFDIDSKDWTGKVKTRLGGDIPGGDGVRGFYCENGMIKGTDTSGHTVYCIHPDGSAEFGDGSAKFNADKSGFIAGGAISWAWDTAKDKFITSFKNVVIKWENLDDEAKDNLKGEPGKDGKVYYTWIRYADDVNGTGISNDPTGKSFIGLAYNKEIATESNTASDYTWSRFRGEDGTDGVPGPAGEDGKPTYTWIAYSDNADGSDMYQIPTDSTKYIGIAVNKDTATESNDPADYTWSRFRGEDGAAGQDAVMLVIEFYNMNGTRINDIPCDIHGTSISGNTVIAKLYRISGSSKEDYTPERWRVSYLKEGVEVLSSQPLESLNFINISLDISSAYDSIVVQALERSIPDYVLIAEKSISKVMSNVPDWLVGWDTNKVQIGSEYMISPKLFTGKNTGTAEEPILTGIVQGDKCITIDGVERSGFYALKDNEIVFSIDAETADVSTIGDMIANAIKATGLNINDKFTVNKDGTINAANGIFNGSLSELVVNIDMNNIIEKTLSFDTGFNFSIQTVSNDCTLYLPTDKSYNGILCSIINGSEWIFPGTSTVNHYRVIVKLDNDDRFCSNPNDIIRYITLSTGRMVRLKAVLRRNKLEWFVLNYQDFTWDNDGQHIYI